MISIPRVYVGHDPGKEGWISWINECGEVLGAVVQPLTDTKAKGDTFDRAGMRSVISNIKTLNGRILWCIEEQQPGAGRNGATVGLQQRGYGLWLGMLSMAGIPVLEVRPKRWRKSLDVPQPRYPKEKAPSKNATRKDREEWAKRERTRLAKQRREGLANAVKRAQQLFPRVDLRRNERCTVPSPDKAISLLLAELARREG